MEPDGLVVARADVERLGAHLDLREHMAWKAEGGKRPTTFAEAFEAEHGRPRTAPSAAGRWATPRPSSAAARRRRRSPATARASSARCSSSSSSVPARAG